MTHLKTALAATAAVFAFSAAAHAADPILPAPTPVAPAPAPAFVWDGFYAGINAGFGFAGEAYDDDGDVIGDFDDINGFLGGVQVGANFQMDMFVLGVEGDIQLTSLSQEVGDVTIDLDYFGTVRARAGVAMDNVMPYLTGGLAFGGVTVDPDVVDSESNTHFGWTVGGGVEVAFDQSTSFKLEYLYTDLGEQEYDFGAGAIDGGLRFHTVRAGVNFHF